MKHSIALCILASMFISCSSQNSRQPSSLYALSAVGITGIKGEVMIYYKEGNHVIVKNCEDQTDLGKTIEEAKANCHGKSNKVPLSIFKETLKQQIDSLSKFNSYVAILLNPLKQDEVSEYARLKTKEEEASRIELINGINTEMGVIYKLIFKSSPSNKKHVLNHSFDDEKLKELSAKINAEIDELINQVVDQKKLVTLGSDSSGKFIYTTLKLFNPKTRIPCGLKGTLDERMEDCALQETSKKKYYSLVTRTKEFKEIYKDVYSGLLWMDRAPQDLHYWDALKLCKLKSFTSLMGGSNGVHWDLPTVSDFDDAVGKYIRADLPNMGHKFWSLNKESQFFNPKFFGKYEKDDEESITKKQRWTRSPGVASIRCVGR